MSPTHIKKGNTDLKKINRLKKPLALMLTLIMAFCLSLTACDSSADTKNAEKIPILTYHKIVPEGTEFSNGLLIAADTFDKEMKYLHDSGYTTLTLDEFYDWYTGKTEVPEKSVVVTFDDGYYGAYHLAYPIIKKYDQAATVFCIGHHIEDVTPEFDPNETEDHHIGVDVIQKLKEEYPRFSFESHTFDMHRKVDGKHPVDVFTEEQMQEDVDKNAAFGFRYLAYPWGDYNDTIKKVLADNGYNMAFAYKPSQYATRSDDQFAVSRIKISGKMKMKKFKKIVSGKFEF